MDEHELRSRMAIEAAGMAVWDATVVNGDVMAGVVHWPAPGAAMVGLAAREADQPFAQFLALVHEDDRDALLRAMRDAVDAAGHYHVGYRVRLAGGQVRSLRADATVLRDAQGRPHRTLGLIRDITDLVEQERLASERECMAGVTLDCIGDGVIATDQHGAARYLNRAAEQLTGWTRQRAVGRDVGEVLPLIDEVGGLPLEHAVYKCLLKREAVGLSAHAMMVTRDGRRVAVEDTAAPIRLANGDMLGAVVVFRDVTHQRALSSQLSWHATHDVLTGLCNRREFEAHVAHALHASKQDDHTHALLYIDLDRFKLVNDTAGHAAGDALLQILANLLQGKMRESDVLARLGGDELGALLGYCQLDQARLIAEEIRQLIKGFRFVWDEHSFEIGASIGMVEISADSKSVSDLLVAADEACYLAKDQGRNRIHVYSESDAVLARRHSEMMWVPRLNDAIQHDRFALYAMPIAGLQGNRLVHEEILLRLKDAAGDVIRPDRFIPAAERYHMMPLLDRWVIRAVCRHIAARERGPAREPGAAGPPAGGARPMFSVNLSGPSMNDDKLHQFIIDQFVDHSVDPAQLCFEITETAAIRNLPKAQDLMARLKLLGCRFSLDDFGSGLSSFGYLRSLPVDFLKIDGSFIRGIAANPVHRAMVEAIHKVGRVIGIQTIAEFVEDAATLDVVNNIGIDYAQGYAVGRERALHA
ncbi:PAS domain S-box-containing protein/diguanylate cyclase (GGDEF) domain-containing protein [Duganella sp. CF517]|uniref:EAL domain-containing protein n=1 Tax=Duganella sp. CF517 TaxID=1881038 RepID=UPI0008B6B142|nr:EAL domain-containing protein [Duganella sp. CF517]SEO04863.1 PAS domain S-box-containing protein/diguanylate cyclase (GGDEF) domain-containing protein [Duganella sp. CF517]